MTFSQIIFIHGNDSYRIERERQGFVQIFEKKYGKENIQHFSLSDTTQYSTYRNELLTLGLFQEKRLFIFSGGREQKTETPGWEMILDEIAKDIAPDDFLVFSHITDHERALIQWLEKNATSRLRNLSWKTIDWEPYTSLSQEAIKKVLVHYENREKQREKWDTNPFLGHAIAYTLQNLALLESDGKHITSEMIEDFSHTYEWARIFDLIDVILGGNITHGITLLRAITSEMSASELQRFYGSFVGILRQSLYILTLRDLKLRPEEIAALLGKIHPFVIKKNYSVPMKAQSLARFFDRIVTSSIAYKSGYGMKKTELWRVLDIEIALLELKK